MSDLRDASEGGRKRDGRHLAISLGIGFVFVAALGAAFDLVGVGVPIGIAIGVAIGTALGAKKSK